MLTKPTQVFLLRHGESNYNALSLYQGCSDRPILTDLGKQQAQTAAQFLQGIPFSKIYTSHLKRVQQTSQIILAALSDASIPLEITRDLRETELPLWQGLPRQQVKEQFSQDYHTWKNKPHEFVMLLPQPTKEQTPHNLLVEKASFYPAIELYSRVARFWGRILQRHRGENILIISHSGTNKALISTALGISPAYYHCLEQSNCGLNLLTFPAGDFSTAKLETMNHLLAHPRLHPPKQGGLRLLLTTDSTTISPLLQDEKIDFTLSQDPESPLPQSPHTVHFPVLQTNFSQIWQQTLQKKSFRQHTELLTGLVIAPAQEIETFLAGMLEISRGLSCHPHTLSSLYFPNSGELPYLQTLNLGLFR